MTPQQALDLFSNCARMAMPIGQIDQYNAAFVALSKLIEESKKPQPLTEKAAEPGDG